MGSWSVSAEKLLKPDMVERLLVVFEKVINPKSSYDDVKNALQNKSAKISAVDEDFIPEVSIPALKNVQTVRLQVNKRKDHDVTPCGFMNVFIKENAGRMRELSDPKWKTFFSRYSEIFEKYYTLDNPEPEDQILYVTGILRFGWDFKKGDNPYEEAKQPVAAPFDRGKAQTATGVGTGVSTKVDRPGIQVSQKAVLGGT